MCPRHGHPCLKEQVPVTGVLQEPGVEEMGEGRSGQGAACRPGMKRASARLGQDILGVWGGEMGRQCG